MSVEAIQCPKCGGPLSVEEGRDSMYCSQCGAGLRITTGSSGHTMATLADIKDDTSLLAMRAALERLEEKLQGCHGEVQGLESARSEELKNWKAQQQLEELLSTGRAAKLSNLRTRVTRHTFITVILLTVGVLCLGLLLLRGYTYWLSAYKFGEELLWDLEVVLCSLVPALALFVLVFFTLRERRRRVKLMESSVQDEGPSLAPAAGRAEKHKERLQQIDVEMNQIRSQIQGIEKKRHTLRAKLDRLTDQL